MKPMIGLGLAVAALATGGAALAQADICADVREVVAAARETPPFASFPDANPRDGRWMFRFRGCGYRDYPPAESARFACDHPDPDRLDPDDLMSRIAQCLPQAVRTDPDNSRPGQPFPRVEAGRFYAESIYVDSGPLRFELTAAHTPRTTDWRFSAYIRDADAETRD